MRYAVEQRMRMIDFLLAEYGHVKRSALISYYGISLPQASEDFRMYMEAFPTNMEYDSGRRRYVRTDDFTPWFP